MANEKINRLWSPQHLYARGSSWSDQRHKGTPLRELPWAVGWGSPPPIQPRRPKSLFTPTNLKNQIIHTLHVWKFVGVNGLLCTKTSPPPQEPRSQAKRGLLMSLKVTPVLGSLQCCRLLPSAAGCCPAPQAAQDNRWYTCVFGFITWFFLLGSLLGQTD